MSHPLLITHPLLVTWVAEGPKNTGPDFGKASPMGLLIVVLLLIAVFGLVWSMNRQLRKVPASFDTPGEASESAPDGAEPAADTAAEGDPKGESGG